MYSLTDVYYGFAVAFSTFRNTEVHLMFCFHPVLSLSPRYRYLRRRWPLQRLHLLPPIRPVPIKIQTALPDAVILPRAQLPLHRRQLLPVILAHRSRMQPRQRKHHARIRCRRVQHPPPRLAVDVRQDNFPDSGCTCPLHHLRPVLQKLILVNMRMRIYIHIVLHETKKRAHSVRTSKKSFTNFD